MEISGKEPDAIFINSKKIKTTKPVLKRGLNSVLLMYTGIKERTFNNHWEVVDLRERSAVVLKKPGTELQPGDFLSMKWYRQEGIFDYDVYGNKKKFGYYRFSAPPGLRKMQFDVYGEVKAYQDGKVLKIKLSMF